MDSPEFTTIPLGRCTFAKVDAADFGRLSAYKWGFIITRGRKYASRLERRDQKMRIFMHREVLGLSFGDKIQGDHKNGDTLDNRRSNLRRASHGQNQHNRGLQKNSTTGYKGVYVAGRKYRAIVKYKNRNHNAGTFADIEQAARAYDKKAAELFGEFARLNFPE